MTCSITELGFVRINANVAAYGANLGQSRALLLEMKANPELPLEFISDANDISFLPSWVKASSQITDGHLVQLAKLNGAVLAALDKGIPEAYLIP